MIGDGGATPGRLLAWGEIERVDAGVRRVKRRLVVGLAAGAVAGGLLLANGPDVSADGDRVMLVLAGGALFAGTAAGYLAGVGYPVWRPVYP